MVDLDAWRAQRAVKGNTSFIGSSPYPFNLYFLRKVQGKTRVQARIACSLSLRIFFESSSVGSKLIRSKSSFWGKVDWRKWTKSGNELLKPWVSCCYIWLFQLRKNERTSPSPWFSISSSISVFTMSLLLSLITSTPFSFSFTANTSVWFPPMAADRVLKGGVLLVNMTSMTNNKQLFF